ncbi:MAG: glycosyltransferase family 2 protein [Actinomycetota bacterium]
MTATPRVTVAMPVYNGAKTLPRAINSVLSQTSNDFELVVIDDGSADRSIDVIESFRDPRIRLLIHEQNLGLAATRDHLIKESRGDYTAWLDQDDWAHPERIAVQVKALDAAPSAVICGTWTKLISEEPPGKARQLLDLLASRSFTDPRDLKATMPFRNAFSTSSLMLRTEIVRSNGLVFDQEYAPAEDYRMWTQISHFGDLIAIPRTLTKIYEYAAGASSQSRERQILGARRTRLELLDELGFKPSDEEAKAHTFLCEEAMITRRADQGVTAEDYSCAASWLDEMQTRNDQLGALDAPALGRACAERFVALFASCVRAYPAQVRILRSGSRASRAIPEWLARRAAMASQ